MGDLSAAMFLAMEIVTWWRQWNEFVIRITLILEGVLIINISTWKVYDVALCTILFILYVVNLVAILIRLVWYGSIVSVACTSSLTATASCAFSALRGSLFFQLKDSTRWII